MRYKIGKRLERWEEGGGGGVRGEEEEGRRVVEGRRRGMAKGLMGDRESGGLKPEYRCESISRRDPFFFSRIRLAIK